MSLDERDLKLLTPSERSCADDLFELIGPKSLKGKVAIEILLRHIAEERRLKRLAMRKLKPKKSKKRQLHYAIIGAHTQQQIGCTRGEEGKTDVLREEPEATFVRMAIKDCEICTPYNQDGSFG